MASEKEMIVGFATTGSLTAASLIMSIAAVTVAAVDRQNLDTQNDRITDLEARVPTLVNDGVDVSGSVSVIGDPPVTDGLTILPKLHFKSFIAGAGVDIESTDSTVVISNIQEITLETAPATEVDPISLVATSTLPNFPQTRNLIAGTGITLTLSGNDIIIALA